MFQQTEEEEGIKQHFSLSKQTNELTLTLNKPFFERKYFDGQRRNTFDDSQKDFLLLLFACRHQCDQKKIAKCL